MRQFHKNLIHALQAATPPCWIAYSQGNGWAAFTNEEIRLGQASGLVFDLFWPSLGDLPVSLTPEGAQAWRSAVTDLLQNRRLRK